MPGFAQQHVSTTQSCQPSTCAQITWKPVPGQEVFAVCVVLILACLLWLGLWVAKGVKFEET